MRNSKTVIWAVISMLVILVSVAYADAVVASIPFPFKAAGKEFTAGKYEVETNLQDEVLKIRSESTGKELILPITTRISARDDESAFVFDKQGDQYYLSEVYMPGIDGFALKGATGKHTHVKVKASKK